LLGFLALPLALAYSYIHTYIHVGICPSTRSLPQRKEGIKEGHLHVIPPCPSHPILNARLEKIDPIPFPSNTNLQSPL
jgi:hypothetical protein